MDIDQGNTSPRYAVESDDSDDEGGLVTTTPAVFISYNGSPGTRRVTVVLGPVGAEWLGAVSAVGAPKGSVSVDNIEERHDAFRISLLMLTPALSTDWPNIRAIWVACTRVHHP
jgi:hypothetical protein